MLQISCELCLCTVSELGLRDWTKSKAEGKKGGRFRGQKMSGNEEGPMTGR